MPPAVRLGLSSPSANVTLVNYTPVPTSQESSLQRRPIMMWATVNYCPSKRLWRNGATGWKGHPFLVLTNHRNLEYLHGAKRLNPRQARWAVFFTQFHFAVNYRPGSTNSKANALSRQLESKSPPPHPDPILPTSLILAPIQWNLVDKIQRAHAEEAPPASCPPSKFFVPFSLCNDIMNYVQSCTICAQSHSSHQIPEGLFEPLPIPQCPWSHIAVDFLMDLHGSNGFTTVLVVIDHFSKACRKNLISMSFPSRDYLPPWKRPSHCSITFFVTMGYQRTLYLIRGPSSLLKSGGPFVFEFCISPTVQRSGRKDSTKKSGGSCTPTAAMISTAGESSSFTHSSN
ncbi:hypothetical protein QTP70_002588 [Hemibagrus guttatus]|uniref:Reverse transcriptase RNase H-like domain-containing protein n=1 Tax=Hemibagrus guttatus TaxID=175788 RepID=A0AAE0QXJ1_9TELE|nr:hypothetical protein QTP70_002588 [Hemibagrus guttatus]